MSNVELPVWVWDLLADLVDEDAMHPKLYYYTTASIQPYNWCVADTLKRVPKDMLHVAEHIAQYRREVAT